MRETAASPFRRGISNIEVSWLGSEGAAEENEHKTRILLLTKLRYIQQNHMLRSDIIGFGLVGWICKSTQNLPFLATMRWLCLLKFMLDYEWFASRSTNPHSFCKLRENGLLRKTHNVGKYGCVNSFTRRSTLIPNIMWLAVYIFFLIIKYVVNNKIKKMHSLPSLPSRSNFFIMNKACDFRFEPDHISVGPFVNQNAT